jgi:hypothetical protein
VERILNSDYAEHVRKLTPRVTGKRVTDTVAGKSGFLLRLDGSCWVAAFVENRRLQYSVGTGEPPSGVLDRLNSIECGEPLLPLAADVPYASESCDIAAEVAKSVNQSIEGLAIGDASFNFCFPHGLELDSTIVNDANGRPTLRVFWEQW